MILLDSLLLDYLILKIENLMIENINFPTGVRPTLRALAGFPPTRPSAAVPWAPR